MPDPGGGLSVRREVAEWIFPLPEHRPMRDCGDAPFMLLAPLLTPLAALDDVLAEWRRHGGNRANRAIVDAAYVARELDVYPKPLEPATGVSATTPPARPRVLQPCDMEVALQRRQLRARRRMTAGQPVLGPYRRMLRCWNRDGLLKTALAGFWALSILLPRPVFAAAFNALVTPGPVREAGA